MVVIRRRQAIYPTSGGQSEFVRLRNLDRLFEGPDCLLQHLGIGHEGLQLGDSGMLIDDEALIEEERDLTMSEALDELGECESARWVGAVGPELDTPVEDRLQAIVCGLVRAVAPVPGSLEEAAEIPADIIRDRDPWLCGQVLHPPVGPPRAMLVRHRGECHRRVPDIVRVPPGMEGRGDQRLDITWCPEDLISVRLVGICNIEVSTSTRREEAQCGRTTE